MGKYFSVCCAIILLSLAFVGIFLMALNSRYFKSDKFNLLRKSARQAAAVTAKNYASHDYRYVTGDVLKPIYAALGTAIEADLYLADRGGTVLVGSRVSDGGLPERMPEHLLRELADRGEYQGISEIGAPYETKQFAVALPVFGAEGAMVGSVVAVSPADALSDLNSDILRMFLISAIGVTSISFVVIYFVTASFANPLQQMAAATRAFAKGDFSIRVPVRGDDEISDLALAFNGMATSLALMESTRRSFTANVSHELKTPMTTIGGFIDGILDGTIPPERQNHYLRIVSSEIQRLSRLVRNMLTLSQIEAGERTIVPTEVEITELVTRTLIGFEQRLEAKNIGVKGLDTGRLWVLADVDLIQQVLYNLIDNAVKFADDGGTLSFIFYPENDEIMVAIRNSGDGVLPEEIPKLFDRFYKSDRSRSRDRDGVGLGLAICKTIMYVNGGEIFVRSEPGRYTEFVIGLPADASRNRKGANRKAPAMDADFTEVGRETRVKRREEKP